MQPRGASCAPKHIIRARSGKMARENRNGSPAGLI